MEKDDNEDQKRRRRDGKTAREKRIGILIDMKREGRKQISNKYCQILQQSTKRDRKTL